MSINSKLSEFPTLLGYMGDKLFSLEELKHNLLRSLPRKYHKQVTKTGKDPKNFTMESLRTFLLIVLEDVAKTHSSKKHKEGNGRQRNDGKHIFGKGNNNHDSSKDPRRSKMFCKYCKNNGKSMRIYQSHNLVTCSFKDTDSTSSNRKRKPNKYHIRTKITFAAKLKEIK